MGILQLGKQSVILLLTALLLNGCLAAGKELFVLMPDPEDGTVGEITVANANGLVRLTKARESFWSQQCGLPASASNQEIEKEFAEVLAAIPTPAEKHVFYFQPASAVLEPDSRQELSELLKAIQQRMPCDIVVLGPSDAQDVDLAQQRAAAVRNLLTSRGIPLPQIDFLPTGENIPISLLPRRTPGMSRADKSAAPQMQCESNWIVVSIY